MYLLVAQDQWFIAALHAALSSLLIAASIRCRVTSAAAAAAITIIIVSAVDRCILDDTAAANAAVGAGIAQVNEMDDAVR